VALARRRQRQRSRSAGPALRPGLALPPARDWIEPAAPGRGVRGDGRDPQGSSFSRGIFGPGALSFSDITQHPALLGPICQTGTVAPFGRIRDRRPRYPPGLQRTPSAVNLPRLHPRTTIRLHDRRTEADSTPATRLARPRTSPRFQEFTGFTRWAFGVERSPLHAKVTAPAAAKVSLLPSQGQPFPP
jgi:hypothetical protein